MQDSQTFCIGVVLYDNCKLLLLTDRYIAKYIHFFLKKNSFFYYYIILFRAHMTLSVKKIKQESFFFNLFGFKIKCFLMIESGTNYSSNRILIWCPYKICLWIVKEKVEEKKEYEYIIIHKKKVSLKLCFLFLSR